MMNKQFFRAIVAFSVITAGVGASSPLWAHKGGHPKSTVEECKTLLDEALQKECIECVTPGKHHFDQGHKTGKRCSPDAEPKVKKSEKKK